ncbi:site-specific integrase [Telluribacter sp. SYSU D00476]|uniref:site-specific integrase n=1 Tax=Telluribacter sp. SYSU D00476 TaxID=2811430 RepID=UPI001FF4126A|nr:site-specific integrase [Telluribacter sp. SYSU D00476]
MTKVKQNATKVKTSRTKRLTVQPYMRGDAIYLKVFHNGKSIAFSTGLTCKPSKLQKDSLIIEGDESATDLLQTMRSDIQRTYADFLITKRHPDLREIRDIALNKKRNVADIPTVIQCLEKYLKEEFEALEGIEYEKKTVEKKRFLVDRIKQYILTRYGNRYLNLSDLKPIDGQSLVNFCKKTFGHGHNHAVLHAEFLKRTLNYAIANEWIDKNPLAFFRPKRERKAVIALKESDLLRLESTTFFGREYNYVRDVFLFCCYTGLAYVDVSKLCSSHLVTLENGDLLIKIQRGKNGNQCIIPVVPQALQLIEKYSNNADCLHRERIFPVFSNQVMNRVLKEIQALCGIDIRLTTHVARKTCASYYIANGVPLTSVATMLGHTKTSTTEQYYTQRSEEAVIQHIQDFQQRKGLK